MTDNTCVIKETGQFQRGIKQGDGMEMKWQLWASLPGGASGKESTCQRDAGSTPELERTAGGGNGNPLHYSCLGNPRDRGAWQDILREIAIESDKS